MQLRLGEIQGLLASGYNDLPWAAYLILEVTDGPRARAWLAERVGLVTWVGRKASPALNVAFTHDGLAALGLAQDALRSFPFAFQAGMASEHRARLLGDTGVSDPRAWRWGGHGNRPAHVLLLIYGATEDALAAECRRHDPGATSGLAVVTVLRSSGPGRHNALRRDHREHFGFNDGIGQPVVAGLPRSLQSSNGAGRPPASRHTAPSERELATGEFVLGYPDEHRRLPASPSVAGTHPWLAPAADIPGRADLGRDGSYLVFRQLQQDVAGFWRDVEQEARRLWGGDPAGPERLAAKLVGRWPSGAPLTLYPDADPALASSVGLRQEMHTNDFDYAADLEGYRCPLGSHIRRANPRDRLGTLGPGDSLKDTRRRRLLRRGRNYGPRVEDAPGEDVERGLHFICLVADLERQFEFVQRMWLQNPAFATLPDELDPLLGGSTRGSGSFTIQGEPISRRTLSLHSHVRMRGGAYWFLPGRSALLFLTGAGDAGPPG